MTVEICLELEPTPVKTLSAYNLVIQTYGTDFINASLVERLRMLKVIVEMMLEVEADAGSADNPEYLSVNESLKFITVLHVAIVEGYAVKAAAANTL